MNTQDDILVQKSNGFGKSGRMIKFIRPKEPCFNKSRKISGYTPDEIRQKEENTIRKWFSPRIILYRIEGHIIGSNSKENALKEYWRVCDIDKVGHQFEVEIIG